MTSPEPPYVPAAASTPPLHQPWYGIGFLAALGRFFRKYATFSGRASLGEFWWSFLAVQVASVVLSTAIGFFSGSLVALADDALSSQTIEILIAGTAGVPLVFGLAVTIPCCSVAVRRLHDTNRSGWFLLIPAGLYALAALSALVGAVGFFAAIGGASVFDSAEATLTLIVGALGLAGLASTGAIVALIVLMTRPSDPRGVRFDRNPGGAVPPLA